MRDGSPFLYHQKRAIIRVSYSVHGAWCFWESRKLFEDKKGQTNNKHNLQIGLLRLSHEVTCAAVFVFGGKNRACTLNYCMLATFSQLILQYLPQILHFCAPNGYLVH